MKVGEERRSHLLATRLGEESERVKQEERKQDREGRRREESRGRASPREPGRVSWNY